MAAADAPRGRLLRKGLSRAAARADAAAERSCVSSGQRRRRVSSGRQRRPLSPFPARPPPAPVRWRCAGFGGGFAAPTAAAPQGGPAEACTKDFLPLREEAERRGKLIKAASDRHAAPEEACKLISQFRPGRSQDDQVCRSRTGRSAAFRRRSPTSYKAATRAPRRCRARSARSREQMKQRQRPAAPQLSDVLGSAAALPEANTDQEGRLGLRHADRQRPHPMSSAAARVADATGNWVDTTAPQWARPYLRARPLRSADRFLAAADAVLVVGGASRRHRA